MENWNLEGKTVGGFYMGHYVRGIVKQSRVAYGARVKHYIDLLAPLDLFDSIRTDVVIEHNDLMTVEHG